MFKKWKRPAVKTPIPDKNKRPFLNGSILRFNEKLRRLPRRNLCRGNEIAKRTETAFESEAGFFNDLCVESHAGELDEIFSICARKIGNTHILALNHVPAKFETMRRQAKLHCEDVHCADRKQSQGSFAPGDAIDHFIDRSIAASGNDFFKSLLDSLPSQQLCSAGPRCGTHGTATSD